MWINYYSYLFDITVFLIFYNNYYNNNKDLACLTNVPEFLLLFSVRASVKLPMCEMAFISPLQCWQQSSCFSWAVIRKLNETFIRIN